MASPPPLYRLTQNTGLLDVLDRDAFSGLLMRPWQLGLCSRQTHGILQDHQPYQIDRLKSALEIMIRLRAPERVYADAMNEFVEKLAGGDEHIRLILGKLDLQPFVDLVETVALAEYIKRVRRCNGNWFGGSLHIETEGGGDTESELKVCVQPLPKNYNGLQCVCSQRLLQEKLEEVFQISMSSMTLLRARVDAVARPLSAGHVIP